MQSVDDEITVNMTVDSDTWLIQPETTTFTSDDSEQRVFFFSQDVFNSLKEGYVQQTATKMANRELANAQRDYDKGMALLAKAGKELLGSKKSSSEPNSSEENNSEENNSEENNSEENNSEPETNNQSGGTKYKYLYKIRGRTHKRR